MSEGIPTNHEKNEGPFRKGALVRFREDLSPELREILEDDFDLDTEYRIYHFSRHDDEGGDSVWIGPSDASERDVEDFDLEEYAEDVRSGRITERNIRAVATRHLKALTS